MVTNTDAAKQQNRGYRLPALLLIAWERISGLFKRHRLPFAFGLIMASSLFLIFSLDAPMQGDVGVYSAIASDLFDGHLPYRDRVVEYPPYAVPIFALPELFGRDFYQESFMVFIVLGDWLIKLALFAAGLRGANSRSFLPLLIYVFTVPFMHYFYLQRYDVWPALLSIAAICLFSSGRAALSGLAVAVGAGVKLYPVLFVVPLLILAARQGKGRRFVAGLTAGVAPMILLGFYLPWWRFAEFQSARGLHVESLYASVIWMGKLLGQTDLHWANVQKWSEIHGPLAVTILPWARGCFILTVVISTTIAAVAACRCEKPSLARLCRLLLVPLLAFVAFNQVLSPQFMIWLLPLAALGSLDGNRWVLLGIPMAIMATPIFIPCQDLDLVQTAFLLARNLTLVAVWVLLIHESFAVSLRRDQNSQGSVNRRPTHSPGNIHSVMP